MLYYRAVNNQGSGQSRHLHTRDDCYRLQWAKGFRSVRRESFPDAEVCPACQGRVEQKDTQDRSHYQALLKAGGSE